MVAQYTAGVETGYGSHGILNRAIEARAYEIGSRFDRIWDAGVRACDTFYNQGLGLDLAKTAQQINSTYQAVENQVVTCIVPTLLPRR